MSMKQFSRELAALLIKHEVEYFVAQGVNDEGEALVIAKGNNPAKLLYLSMDLTKEIIDKIKVVRQEEEQQEEEEAMQMEARFQSSNKADIKELLGQILSTLGK